MDSDRNRVKGVGAKIIQERMRHSNFQPITIWYEEKEIDFGEIIINTTPIEPNVVINGECRKNEKGKENKGSPIILGGQWGEIFRWI